MNGFFDRLVMALLLALYAGLPAAIVWGWVRWARRRDWRTICSALSLLGFALATASALLAVCSIIYANAIGGFGDYDPSLLRIFRIGGMTALAGLAFAIGGVWRRSSLRWHAPACALGILLFWFMMAAAE